MVEIHLIVVFNLQLLLKVGREYIFAFCFYSIYRNEGSWELL